MGKGEGKWGRREQSRHSLRGCLEDTEPRGQGMLPVRRDTVLWGETLAFLKGQEAVPRSAPGPLQHGHSVVFLLASITLDLVVPRDAHLMREGHPA